MVCAVCKTGLTGKRIKAKTCENGECQRIHLNQRKRKSQVALVNKSVIETEGSSQGVTLTNATALSEEQKTTQEVEQTVAFEKKQKSIHSVETSTTVRQVNGGSPETIMETKVLNVEINEETFVVRELFRTKFSMTHTRINSAIKEYEDKRW